MALNGIIYYYTDEETPTFSARLVWNATTNISTYTSTVSYTIQVCRINTTSANTSDYTGSTRFIDDDGNDYGSATGRHSFHTTTKSVGTAWVSLFSNSLTVSHNRSTGAAPVIWVDGMFYGTNGVYFLTDRYASITLNAIPMAAYISSAPNFTDADNDNPTITYYNAPGARTSSIQACISITGDTDDIPYRDIDRNGTTYTFNLSDEEREMLRNATLDAGSASIKVRFYIKSVVEGHTQYRYLEKTFTVIDADPELSAFLLDTNEKTVALTGDSLASLIRGYSNVSYEMSATPRKGASIVSYSAVNGSSTQSTSSGTFYGVNNNTFKLSATDSRGLTTTKEFQLNIIDYFKPTCSQKAEIDMIGETTAKITIEVDGKWSSTHFGAVHNALRVECRYKGDSGVWSEWEGADYISDSDTYKITYTKSDLDYTQSYTVQSRAVDLLETVETAEYALQLIPVFDWDKEGFNFNVPVSMNENTVLRANDTGRLIISADGGGIYLRPNGTDNEEGQIVILPTGEISGSVADYVVEQGTEPMGSNGTWYWTKWASGKAECYGTRNYGNVALYNGWEGTYHSEHFNQDLPGIFSEAPHFLDISFYGANSFGFITRGEEMPTATTSGKFAIWRPDPFTLKQVYISFRAIGRWK
jgi:hypothetical protein